MFLEYRPKKKSYLRFSLLSIAVGGGGKLVDCLISGRRGERKGLMKEEVERRPTLGQECWVRAEERVTFITSRGRWHFKMDNSR